MHLTTSSRRCYRLADHVRACTHDGQVILLDLRRDKYLGLSGAHAAPLSQVIVDWPAQTSATPSCSGQAALDGWVRKLADQQLLSDVSPGRERLSAVAEPLESLDTESHVAGQRIGWRRPLNLALSAAIATFWIKRFSLVEIETRVGRLRASTCTEEKQASTASLRDAVSAYTRLRPFLFTVHDQCLHDSLTLVRYLANEGMFSRWIIGVRTRPFAAHSWVQSGHVVLNDVQEHVRSYTPILVV